MTRKRAGLRLLRAAYWLLNEKHLYHRGDRDAMKFVRVNLIPVSAGDSLERWFSTWNLLYSYLIRRGLFTTLDEFLSQMIEEDLHSLVISMLFFENLHNTRYLYRTRGSRYE